MITGDKVVCVNDNYDPWVVDIYNQLPIKGFVYTVESVSMGRADPLDRGIESMVDAVTLKEVTNPSDPYYKGGVKELQFNSERFRKVKKK